MIKRDQLRLVIAPVVLSLIDAGITLWFQAPGYFSGRGGPVNEVQLEGHLLMAAHPVAGLLGHALWIASFCFLILILPRRAAVFIALVVTIGHMHFAAGWLPGRVAHAYQVGNAFAVLAALLLAGSLPIPRTGNAKEDLPAQKGLQLWAKRAVVFLLIAIPVFVCCVPHGEPPLSSVVAPPQKPGDPVVYRYGPRAGESGGPRGIAWPVEVPGIGGTSVQYGMWGDGPAFVVWADSRGYWSGGSSAVRGAAYSRGTYNCEIGLLPDRSAKLQAVIFENELGRMSNVDINGSPYDLNKGGLFLAAVHGAEVEIFQLTLDISKLSPDTGALETFAGEHPEIAAFFAKCRANK